MKLVPLKRNCLGLKNQSPKTRDLSPKEIDDFIMQKIAPRKNHRLEKIKREAEGFKHATER